MAFIMNNWFLIIIAIAALASCGYVIYAFIKRPTTEQISKVKEWLLASVVEAEKELGKGTGQIKLSYVYNKFIERFPSLSEIISFSTFSLLVDESLDKFRTMLESNTDLQNYIGNTKEEKKNE